MKAAVTTGEERKIIVKDVPKPQVRPGTLLLKTKCNSICGTDLEYVAGSLSKILPKGCGKLQAGAILGHEFCAEVVELGEGVEGWSVGDRATRGGVRGSCGQCWFCLNRLPWLCLGVAGLRTAYGAELVPGGYGGRNGAMAEYFIWPAKGAQKVPDSVSDEEAALVEPLRTSIGIVRSAEVTLGDSVVITGAGKIGLGALLCAKIAGATPVTVIDVVKSRLDKALEMGADVVINANEADVISKVAKLTEVGPDKILICSRAGKVLNQSVDMVRRGGTIVLGGFVPPTELNPVIWVLKNLRLVGELGSAPLSLSMHLIASKRVNVKPLISAIMPLEDAQKAFDSMYSGENITVLLKP